jgi:3-hydroxyisobutyrate dehydrogenase-like beta-hydroxyacid dehydrogenase
LAAHEGIGQGVAMARQIALLGFGEAGQAFAGAPGWSALVRAYDKLTDDPSTRSSKLADYASCAVCGSDRIGDALVGAELVLSLVTAGDALIAARSAAQYLQQGAIYCDMNSVSPETKRAAAKSVEQAGGRYVDVAIMAPVNPARLAVPLLLSGIHAPDAVRLLRETGFRQPRGIGGNVGDASAIKMIRSVIVKGIEALTAEAMSAAFEADVVDEVVNSLDASGEMSWASRADYNLERMLLHGTRRAEEMEEAVRTLEALGVEPRMTRETARIQCEIGARRIDPGPGLASKIAQLRPGKAHAA